MDAFTDTFNVPKVLALKGVQYKIVLGMTSILIKIPVEGDVENHPVVKALMTQSRGRGRPLKVETQPQQKRKGRPVGGHNNPGHHPGRPRKDNLHIPSWKDLI